MFSTRLPARLQPNPVSEVVARARKAGRVLFDLTETNPTAVGLPYPDGFEAALGDPQARSYEPSALGTLAARTAVAASYPATAGVTPDRVMLTASTSEAYSFIFKLLCDAGDEVLVPRPSYPLFDLLTRLDGVQPVAYRLDPAGGWCLDRDSVERAVTSRTRAILVVSPNNPTGSVLRQSDRDWLVACALRHGLALVSDEVFADYPLSVRPDATSLLGEDRVLTFTLGGLSKSAALPQMKLAWTTISGPSADVADAMIRLEIIADSYLSVSTPVQVALPRLLEAGRVVREAVRARLATNLATLQAVIGRVPVLTRPAPDGGWSVVLRLPAILSEEQWVLTLLEDQGVLVHPGYFFDLDTGVHVVISLLPAPDLFASGVNRIADMTAGRAS